MYLAGAVESEPEMGGARVRGRLQHFAPVVADRQRHARGGQRLEHRLVPRRRAVLVEQAEQGRGIRVGHHLVHRVRIEGQPAVRTEPVRPVKHPGDVFRRDRAIAHALRPAVPADRGAARRLDAQVQGHRRARGIGAS